MRRSLSLLTLFLSLWPALHAAEVPDKTRLKLPWDTLQRVLRLDGKDVRLTTREFDTLIRHTAVGRMPNHQVVDGDIVLSREDFGRLMQNLLPPAPPEAGALLTQGRYRARLVGDSVVVIADLTLETRPRTGQTLNVDLFPEGPGFQEILIDGRPAATRMENGRLWLTTDRSGTSRVTLRYAVRAGDADKKQTLTFPVARTPITELELLFPDRGLDVAVTPSLMTDAQPAEGGTRVKAVLSPTNAVTATWNPVVATSREPARMFADVDHLLTVSDDALRVHSAVKLQVLRNRVAGLTFEIPEGFFVLDVRGDGVGEWRETTGQPTLLTVPFSAARQGDLRLDVVTERVLGAGDGSVAFGGLTLRGAQRQKGFIGIELLTASELPEPAAQGLTRVDVSNVSGDVPPDLLAQTQRPLLYGYTYRHTPFGLTLQPSLHETVTIAWSAVDNASAETFLLIDGRRAHRVTFQVRNDAKQFLALPLIPGAKLWSAFVNRRAVKPTEGPKGEALIPLDRSPGSGESLQSFPVELILYEPGKRLFPLGREVLRLPMPDLAVGRVNWTVYTPDDAVFGYWGREFESPTASVMMAGAAMPFGETLNALRRPQRLIDRKSTRLNSSHNPASRMPSSA
jgi:hypothetical protein